MAQPLVLVNRCTVLTDAQISVVIPAFQAQVTEDWLPHWPGRDATIGFVGLNGSVPNGVWPLYILDHTDIPGAGGYHDDDMSLVQGKVFAADAMELGQQWTVDASHELLEMLGDPLADTILPIPPPAGMPHLNWHCLQEVCDACEEDLYAYMKKGLLVSDFCLPSYFTHAGPPYDFRGQLPGPSPTLLPGGYLGIELPNGQWTQVTSPFADGKMSRRAKNNHRIGRRVAALTQAHAG